MRPAAAVVLYPIVFYDGECGFCDVTVQFLLARGAASHYHFATLRGKTAQALLYPRLRGNVDTIVLRLPNGHSYDRSTAVLKVLAGLGGAWRIAFVFFCIPRKIRDFCYDQFARRRYRWFGRLEHCRIPTDAERAAFLD